MDATATGQWRQALDRLPDRDLFELDDQIADLVEMPGWERVVSWVDGGHRAVLRSLTQGATKSHADYARQVGYLAGLEEAPNVVKAIADAASKRREKLEAAAVADQLQRQGGSTP